MVWTYFRTGWPPSVLPDLAVGGVPKTQLWNQFSFTVPLNCFRHVWILSFPSIILISLFMLIHFPSNVLLSGNVSLQRWGGYLFACRKRTGHMRRNVSCIPMPVGWECEWSRGDTPALHGYGSSLGREGHAVTFTHSPWAHQSLGFPFHAPFPKHLSEWTPPHLSLPQTGMCLLSFSFPFLPLTRDHLSSCPKLFFLSQEATLTAYYQIYCSPKWCASDVEIM